MSWLVQMPPPPENFLEPQGEEAPLSTPGQEFNSQDDDNGKGEKKSFLFHSLFSFPCFLLYFQLHKSRAVKGAAMLVPILQMEKKQQTFEMAVLITATLQ